MTQPSRRFSRVPAAFATRVALQMCVSAAFVLTASAAALTTTPTHPVHTPVRVASHSAANAPAISAKTKRVAGHVSGRPQDAAKDSAKDSGDAKKNAAPSAPGKKSPAPNGKPSVKPKSAKDAPAPSGVKPKPSQQKHHKAIEPDGDPQILQQAAAPTHSVSPSETLTATHDKNVRHSAPLSTHTEADQSTNISAQAEDHSRASTEDFLRAAGASTATAAALAADTEDTRGTADPDAVETARISTQPASQKTLARNAITTQPSAARVAAVAAAANADKDAPAVTPVKSRKEPSKPLSAKAAARALMPADRDEEARVIDAALVPNVLPKLITASGRLIVPPPMKGTHDILVHQNFMANNAGLSRIQDDDDLDRMVAQHLLSPIASSDRLIVNPELPLDRRYARPWTVQLVNDIARDFFAKFHQPLHLNSAVRTVAYQLRLQRVNGNAAAVDGDAASPHLTGQAIDFGKKGMSVAQIAWMRLYLAPLMTAGKLDVEEEFQQACFHISVYRSYAPAARKPTTKSELAQLHGKPAPIVRMPPSDDQTPPDSAQ